MPDRKPRSSAGDIDAVTPRIVDLYNSGKTTREIAEEVGVSRETVRRRLISYGVEMQPGGGGRPKNPATKPRDNPLSQEEIDRLRRQVGFDPNKQGRGIRVL